MIISTIWWAENKGIVLFIVQLMISYGKVQSMVLEECQQKTLLSTYTKTSIFFEHNLYKVLYNRLWRF